MSDITMTSFEPQPRDSLGKFGTKPQSYPEVELAENVHASFLFPPRTWSNTEDYIHFWMTEPISDEALTNFASAYGAAYDEWIDGEGGREMSKRMEDWGNSREALDIRNQQGIPALQDAREAYAAKLAEEYRNAYPERIPRNLVREVARAAQIIDNLRSLPTDLDRDKARESVVYTTRAGKDLTAQVIWDAWYLDKIMPDAFYPRDGEVARRIRELTERLERVQGA